MTIEQTNAIKSIEEIDKTLNMLKLGRDQAKDSDKKQWSERIDAMLDERIKHMAIRGPLKKTKHSK
jgi:hypothetical protein